MAQAVSTLPPVERVVEIGAGTGAITQHLLPLKPLIVEIDEAFAVLLQRRFPQLDIHHGCGLQFLNALTSPIGLVISVPLINNPLREQFIEAIQQGHHHGLIRWCVIFTYGMNNPLLAAGFAQTHHHRWVLRNLPPAHIWTYH